MTTLAALRRASRNAQRGSAHSRISVPVVTAVPACVLCRLSMTAPGACPGRTGQHATRRGLGHESHQPVTNRALRRQRFLYARDGLRVGRAIPRVALLTRSYSRLRPLHLAALADRRRLATLTVAQQQRLLEQDLGARARAVRRQAGPGRLRAEAFEAAWRAASLAKQQARADALAQADATVARMRDRQQVA